MTRDLRLRYNVAFVDDVWRGSSENCCSIGDDVVFGGDGAKTHDDGAATQDKAS
jgi:hypothetical protein